MTDVNQAAEEAIQIIAQVEGWTSAPRLEATYKAGFLAGASWQREQDQQEIDRLRASVETMTRLLDIKDSIFDKQRELRDEYRRGHRDCLGEHREFWMKDVQAKRIIELETALEGLLEFAAPRFTEEWAEYNANFEAAKEKARQALDGKE